MDLNELDKEKLEYEFITLRGYYFNRCNEKIECFLNKYQGHPLKDIVLKYIDTSFKEIFETSEKAIEEYLSKKK